MDDRRTTGGGLLYWLSRRSWRFWIIVAALPILYVVSFGPACWIASYTGIGRRAIAIIYYPLIENMIFGPSPIAKSLHYWTHLFSAGQWEWFNDTPGQFDFVD